MKQMEYNFELVEGMQRRIDVALVKPDGSALPCENFLVYGAAFAPGCEARPFEVKRTERGCTVVVPGLCATRMGWHYQLLAAEYATGVEWVVASGEIAVAPRLAHAEGAVSPEGVELVCTVDHVTQSVDVVVGESTVECAAAAEYAKESAEEAAELCGRAATAAEEAQRSAEAAQKSADDAEDIAQRADDYMADAEAAAKNANESAEDAAVDAQRSAAAAEVATAAAGTAGARAADAAASAKAAADSASDAIEAEAAARASEAAAARSAEEARGYDMRAYEYGQAAEAAAGAAAAHKRAAEDAMAAAASSAEAAAEHAELLGDAALQGSNNTFAAGKTQTVNGIAVFNGDTVLNGECSGAAIDKQKAMAALQDLQGYKQCVYYHRGGTATSGIVTQVQPEIFSCAAKTDGEKAGAYYAKSKDWASTYACMLLRYDKTSPVEIMMNMNRDLLAYPSRGNNLYAKAWGMAGNSLGCFSSLFIDGTHVYVKQSHSNTQGHYAFSVYDLGVSDVLKNTNKIVWYLGNGFSRKIKMCVWGLVGNELQLVGVFNTGVSYSEGTKLMFTLWGKATNVYAVRDETPELQSLVMEKNKAVTNKDFQLVNNDMPATRLQTVDATGGELVVTFAEAAGCGWQVERLPEWISADLTECENGGQILLTIAPNETGAAREDYMLFTSVGNHAHGYPCTVCNEIKQNA